MGKIENHAKRLAKQKQMIRQSLKSEIHFAKVLQNNGWTYDDLVYENYRETESKKSSGYHPLDSFKQNENHVEVVSFFSGAGGLDLGFEAAGFSHTALVEHHPLFCSTLRHNRPEWSVIGPPTESGDVSNFDDMTSHLNKKVKKNFDGIFVGGPPCQPFSIAANQRFSKSGENFKRVGFAHEKNGNLLFDYIELIKKYRPRAFLIENVPGLIEVDDGEQLQIAYRDLEKAGYTLNQPMVIIAADYLVPQNRTRVFIVGNRIGAAFQAPQSTNSQLTCAKVFDLSLINKLNHITREHSAESIERYMRLEYGERDQLGRVDRLDPALPSKTVIAGGSNGGGRSHLHPYIPRTLSVRESARIQTFPDDYEFIGPVARQFTQVGNAVPPVLGAQLATAMYRSFYK